MIEYGGSPADWIAKDGMPAKCLGDPLQTRGSGGLPSYESQELGLVVYELGVVHHWNFGTTMIFPNWYWSALMITHEGLVPLHHGPDASWSYQPWLYRRVESGLWEGLGSQREIAWRYALWDLEEAILSEDLDKLLMLRGPKTPMEEAEDRAEKLLREHLTGSQLVEWIGCGYFRLYGASGRAYTIHRNNGFAQVDAVTNAFIKSYCLHTDGWIPASDVALATKFSLEDAELEAKTIEGSNVNIVNEQLEATPELRYACDMERELLE